VARQRRAAAEPQAATAAVRHPQMLSGLPWRFRFGSYMEARFLAVDRGTRSSMVL
jgi:hypothetical protein